MSFRVSPISPYGSLLKGAGKVKAEPERKPGKAKPKRKPTRQAREHDDKHLAAIRRCPCLACDVDPCREAAHLRMSAPGKPVTGTGVKPDDRFALPLCPDCHTRGPGAQHTVGEPKFWSALGLDPFAIAARLYAVSPGVPAMRGVCFAEREKRK